MIALIEEDKTKSKRDLMKIVGNEVDVYVLSELSV